MSATALDPAETISAAVRDLYEQLRQLVDRGPTDDPGLLDELGKLTGPIRARITRARKRAAATELAAAKPVEPHRAPPTPEPVRPVPAVKPPAPARPAAAVTPKVVAPARPLPASTVRSGSPRTTVPIAPPPASSSPPALARPAGAPATVRLPATEPGRGPLRRWVALLVVVLVGVLGVGLAVATGHPFFLAGVLLAPLTLNGIRRWVESHRPEDPR